MLGVRAKEKDSKWFLVLSCSLAGCGAIMAADLILEDKGVGSTLSETLVAGPILPLELPRASSL